MKVISVQCPSCGAALSIEEGRTKCFCQYCGTPITVDDGSININQHVEQNINYKGEHASIIRDEAKLKELELERLRTELEYKRFAGERKSNIIRTIIKILWVFIVFLAINWGNIYDSLRYDYHIRLDYHLEDNVQKVLVVLVFMIPIILLVTRRKK